MRLVVKCIMLASIVTLVAANSVRNKRDFAYWKNLITTHLFGSSETTNDLTDILGPPAILVGNEENFKLYRIPGFNNILIKATPKTTTKTESTATDSEKEPTVSILENFLGTKTMNDTLKALQDIRDILQSGVLTAKRETKCQKPETVFIIPPMMPDVNRQAIFIKPEPVAPCSHHHAAVPMVHNFLLPDLKPVPVQTILPLPETPQYTFKQTKEDGWIRWVSPDGREVFVTESKKPITPPVHILNRFQHILNKPLLPLPIPPTSFIVPSPVKPVGVYEPIAPFLVPPPIFVQPPEVAAVRPHCSEKHLPCKKTVVLPPVLVKDTVAVPVRLPNLINENFPVIRPTLVKDTVLIRRPPSIIIDRLDQIVGGKVIPHKPIAVPSSELPARDKVIEQSKSVNVQPLSANGASTTEQYSFKVVNKDGTVTKYSKLKDDIHKSNDEGYFQTDDGKIFYSRLVKNHEAPLSSQEGEERYLHTQDGKIFYSRLVKDHPTFLSIQDEDVASKKHRKHQYTVTSLEESKNISNRDDVEVTYGNDKDKAPFLSYKVPGRYSFQQVNNIKDQKNIEEIVKTVEKKDNSQVSKQENVGKSTASIAGPSNYKFKQIHDDGSVTEYFGYNASNTNVVQTSRSSNDKEEALIHGVSSAKEVDFKNKINEQHVTSDGIKYWSTAIHSVPIPVVATNLPSTGQTPKLPGSYSFQQMQNIQDQKNVEELVKAVEIKDNSHSNKQENVGKSTASFSGPSNYNFKQIHDDGSITEYFGYNATKTNTVHSSSSSNDKEETLFNGESSKTKVDPKNKINEQHVSSDGVRYWSTAIHSIPATEVETNLLPIGQPPKLSDSGTKSQKVNISTSNTFTGNYSFKMTNSDREVTGSIKDSNIAEKHAFSDDNPIVVPDDTIGKRIPSRGDIPEALS